MSEVVGEHKISGEGVGKGVVEVQNFQEFLPLDGVQVAVGESPDVGCTLAYGGVLPEGIAKHITLTENGNHLVILDHLQ